VNKKLLLVQKENNICMLTLNRPKKQNSLSIELIELLESSLRELAQDDAVRTVILRGAGDKAFCSGFDIGSLPTSSKGDLNERLKTLDPVDSLLQSLVSFPIPIIAMLNGFAFGLGCAHGDAAGKIGPGLSMDWTATLYSEYWTAKCQRDVFYRPCL
jgi:enoyl-CoA hydratase/carnithine racemase